MTTPTHIKKCDLSKITEVVRHTFPDFPINKVYLFGSFARGEQTDSSDIDLCLETGKSFSLLNASQFSREIKSQTGREVDVVSQSSLFSYVEKSMIQDRVLLYERV